MHTLRLVLEILNEEENLRITMHREFETSMTPHKGMRFYVGDGDDPLKVQSMNYHVFDRVLEVELEPLTYEIEGDFEHYFIELYNQLWKPDPDQIMNARTRTVVERILTGISSDEY